MLRINKIFISSFFFFFSCKEEKTDSELKTSEKEEKIWYFEGSDQISVRAEYLNGKLDGRLVSYYLDNTVKAAKRYSNGFMVDTSYYFYPSGQISEIQVHALGNNRLAGNFLNIWVKLDTLGNIIGEESHYYTIFNNENCYSWRSKANLQVYLTEPFFDSECEAVIGEFDSLFNLLSMPECIPCDSFYLVIPLPTDKLGIQNIKFILNDYKWLDEEDSIKEVKPILIDYVYEVYE